MDEQGEEAGMNRMLETLRYELGRMLRAKNFYIGIALSVSFFAFAVKAEESSTILGTLFWVGVMTGSLSVLVPFWRWGWEGLVEYPQSREGQFALGLTLIAAGMFGRGAMVVFWRLAIGADVPMNDYLLIASTLTYFNAWIVTGCILQASAPSVIGGHIPSRQLIRQGILIASTFTLAWILIALGVGLS